MKLFETMNLLLHAQIVCVLSLLICTSSFTFSQDPMVFELSNSDIPDVVGRDGPAFIYGSPVVDLNHDGFPDVIYAGPKWKNGFVDELSLFRFLINDQNFGFVVDPSSVLAETQAIPKLIHARQLDVADFNNDGFIDVLVAGAGFDGEPFPGERNVLLLSQTNGRYIDAKLRETEFSYDGFTHGQAIGDIDQDGDIDIVLFDIGGSDVDECVLSILTNDGAANFTVHKDWLPSEYLQCSDTWLAAELADLNGDGFLELILGGEPSSRSLIFWNNGTGNFSQPGPYQPTFLPAVNEYEIVVEIENIDLNQDGYEDLLLSRTRQDPFYAGRYIQAFINNMDGSFTDESVQYFPDLDLQGKWINRFVLADMNVDGVDDIVLQFDQVDSGETQGVWIKHPTGVFSSADANVFPKTGGFIPLDADNDFDLDLLVLNVSFFGTPSQIFSWDLLVNQTPYEQKVNFVNPSRNQIQQTFLRFTNRSNAPVSVEVFAHDDTGVSAPLGNIAFQLEALQSIQLTSQDIETGNLSKGLSGQLGAGQGKWQLTVESTPALQITNLIRTPDGFLTNLGEQVPISKLGSREVYFANPSSNHTQTSFIRVVNRSDSWGLVTITGVDDSGTPAPEGEITFSLNANESKQLNSLDYENGNDAKGLTGSLGDGVGKWHLSISSDLDLGVMSLIRAPGGFLTNLSEIVPQETKGNHRIYFANPASEKEKSTFIRVVNTSAEPALVVVSAIDEAGNQAPAGDVIFELLSFESKQITSFDLENGNAGKGLTGALGNGEGRWQITISTNQDIKVMNLIRTEDGFLTNLSRPSPRISDKTTELFIFNPASNQNQRSFLWIVNKSTEAGTVTVTGIDDSGNSAPGGSVSFDIDAHQSKEISSQDLEFGNPPLGLRGALGDGAGKWHLKVESDLDVAIMNLLDTPTGFLTNLSQPVKGYFDYK